MIRKVLVSLAALAAAFSPAAYADSGWHLLNMTQGVTEISRRIYSLHMLILWVCVIIGVVVFAVLPANGGSWLTALGLGALLGLVAYGTYDFTNLSTLRNWPVALSLIDVCWGVVLTGVAASAGSIAASAFGAK